MFHLAKPAVQQRLAKATGIEAGTSAKLSEAIGKLFDHFTKRGARACAISLPPDFGPSPVERNAVDPILKKLQQKHEPSSDELATLSRFVFWTLAEQCAERRLPFDLMIGVNRRVYEDGVFQGQDLFDQRTSLIQYRRLFNAFPKVDLPDLGPGPDEQPGIGEL